MLNAGGNSASAASVAVTLTSPVPAGWVVIAAIGGGTATSSVALTDSAGNTWYLVASRQTQGAGGNGGSAYAAVAFTPVTHALQAGDTVTATFIGSGTPERAVSLVATSDVIAFDQQSGGIDTNSSTFSSSLLGVSSAYELVVGAAATYCATTPLTFNLDDGGFSELQSWTSAGSSGILGELSSGNLTNATYSGTASDGGCTYVSALASFETGPSTPPSNLALSHTANSKAFTVSFTAGRGNGGANGCRLQYQDVNGTWHGTGTLNCDQAASGLSATLPGDGWVSSWSTPVPVRLQRVYDSAVLGTFSQKLSCTPKSGSASSTPTIDEDCDGNWDNTTCTTFTWVHSTVYSTSFSACTNVTGTSSTFACNASSSGDVRYTDGQSTILSPASTWSSPSVGTGCQGSNTGAVQWTCTPSNCTYF